MKIAVLGYGDRTRLRRLHKYVRDQLARTAASLFPKAVGLPPLHILGTGATTAFIEAQCVDIHPLRPLAPDPTAVDTCSDNIRIVRVHVRTPKSPATGNLLYRVARQMLLPDLHRHRAVELVFY